MTASCNAPRNIPSKLLVLFPTIFWLVVACLMTAGCAPKVVPIASVVSDRSPANLAVLSERRINDTLELLVELTPLVVWPAESISLELVALSEGEEIAHSTARISDVTADLLRPGSPVQVPISVRAPQMTDYRLEVKWGAYAALAETKSPAPQQEGALELVDVHLSVIEQPAGGTNCTTVSSPFNNPCPVGFLYSASLRNRTNKIINSVTLVAYFNDASGALGEASEVSMSDLKLAPGEERALRVTFDAPVASGARQINLTPSLAVARFESF